MWIDKRCHILKTVSICSSIRGVGEGGVGCGCGCVGVGVGVGVGGGGGGGRINIKMSSYWYRDPHVQD